MNNEQFDYILNNLNNNYVEGVSIGHFFVLFDENGKAKNDPCKCKDYFQDYFWACYTNKKVSNQYGYSCDPEPLTNYYYLAIGYTNGVEKTINGKYTASCTIPKEWVKNLKRFMRALSLDLHLPCPVITIHPSNKLYIVKFRKSWTKYSYLISLLTYCLRLGCYVNYKDFLSSTYTTMDNPFLNINGDSHYMHKIQKNVEYLKENGMKDIAWGSYKDQSNVHNYSGIFSINLVNQK